MIFPNQHPNNFHNRMFRTPNNNLLPFRGANRMPARNNINQLMQPFSQPQSTTSLATKGVDGISKTLNNVQQVLKVVQSTAPIVQEYGPMVRNIPMMYRMVKAFKEVDGNDEDTTDAVKSNQSNNDDQVLENEVIKTPNEGYKKPVYNGQPKPKLYI